MGKFTQEVWSHRQPRIRNLHERYFGLFGSLVQLLQDLRVVFSCDWPVDRGLGLQTWVLRVLCLLSGWSSHLQTKSRQFFLHLCSCTNIWVESQFFHLRGWDFECLSTVQNYFFHIESHFAQRLLIWYKFYSFFEGKLEKLFILCFRSKLKALIIFICFIETIYIVITKMSYYIFLKRVRELLLFNILLKGRTKKFLVLFSLRT